jgi:hypothetical protein
MTSALLSLALFACSNRVEVESSGQALPPKYLAVEGFQSCLQTEDQGSHQSWCMPDARPAACAEASWAELSALRGSDRVAACRGAAP